MITRSVMRVCVALVALPTLMGCGQDNGYEAAAYQAKLGKVNDARMAMVKVADSGNIQAMAWLMQDATAQGLQLASARKQFVVWAERCAEKGNATCAESAGIFYWSGIDGAIDFEMAEKWFIKAKANGSLDATAWLDDVKKRKPASSSIRKLEA